MGAAYRRLFESPDGQAVLADLMERAGMLSTSMVIGDPHVTSYREGRRSLGLELLQLLQWGEMELVALARRRTADALRETEGSNVVN